jgi:hypothetical protein
MNKERLEWIMSGLNRYNLTKGENQFVKSAEQDFNQKNKLTEKQEEKLGIFIRKSQDFYPIETISLPRKMFPQGRPGRKDPVQNS